VVDVEPARRLDVARPPADLHADQPRAGADEEEAEQQPGEQHEPRPLARVAEELLGDLEVDCGKHGSRLN
jgi:hypothetical protein